MTNIISIKLNQYQAWALARLLVMGPELAEFINQGELAVSLRGTRVKLTAAMKHAGW